MDLILSDDDKENEIIERTPDVKKVFKDHTK
jgi:hypothetical protein